MLTAGLRRTPSFYLLRDRLLFKRNRLRCFVRALLVDMNSLRNAIAYARYLHVHRPSEP